MRPLPVGIGNWIPFFISATGDDFILRSCTHHSTSVSFLIYNAYNKRLPQKTGGF
jgi:hypothetical protein